MNVRWRTTISPAAALLCASIVLLSGCGIGKSAADRVNAAFPIGADIIAGKSGLDALAKDRPLDAKAIDDDYAKRMRARALDCGHGYQPSLFDSDKTIHGTLIADQNLLRQG